ncbi:MAG: response regulator [bacterium]|nr:response regulator [bacterium]
MTKNSVDILLVEDNPNDVELTVRALKKHNLANKLVVVNDGAEALDYVFHRNAYAGIETNDKPKVILLDLKLPKVDGLEVLRKIRADERTRLIPVVILTSSSQEQDMVESYKLGVNSYILKPVDFDKFVEMAAQIGLYWLLLNKLPEI